MLCVFRKLGVKNQMVKPSIAVVFFAKTKELTPVKTRLAKDVSQDLAKAFYARSVGTLFRRSLEWEAAYPTGKAEFYWALAEPLSQAASYWPQGKLLEQGLGGLGERLHNVYSGLKAGFDVVHILGTDLPHLPKNHFGQVIQFALQSKFNILLGPSEDGGFYSFTGKAPIPQRHWTSVTYSSSHTLLELESSLSKEFSLHKLEECYDIDTASDLKRLYEDVSQNQIDDVCTQQELKAFFEAQPLLTKVLESGIHNGPPVS